MKIKFLEYEGIRYLVPLDFEFLPVNIGNYPSFCGAGDGIGNKIVPDTIEGWKISHVCHVHDESWSASSYSFLDFVISNIMFLYNLFIYLMSKKDNRIRSRFKAIKASIYVISVSTIGWRIFKQLKS